MDEAEHCHSLGFIYEGRLIANGPPSTLKRGLDGSLVEVEVESGALLGALEALQAHPRSREVAMFGAKLHVTLDSPEGIPGVQAALAARGIAVRRIEAILPSLEDVFVSLVAREVGA